MKFMNKKNLIELKKRTKFFQGLILGLFITSTLSYAVVTFNTFTSGSTISSSQMNANFATIKTKLDVLDIGYVGVISANTLVTCVGTGSNPMFPGDHSPVTLTTDYTDGNFAGNLYTIPATGLYRLYFYSPTEDNMGFGASVDLSTDSGATWSTQVSNGGMSPQNTVYKFSAGDKLRVSAGCGTMASGGDSTIDSTKFMFAIKKF
ncbi:MAG: hypothetical protein EHM20_11895 [Alphaproteobacteria bacterium]|nr:MAG: hypothetical protein EHM20_11895 [Alphaproteobacteria bacterium]